MFRQSCQVEGCSRRHKARGYCQTHYMQFKRGVPVTPEIATRQRNKPPECVEPDCQNPVKAKGLCGMHYQRLLANGHTKYRVRTRVLKSCSVPGCGNVWYAKGACHAHYARARKIRERFGMTFSDYLDMLKAQAGKCKICGAAEESPHSLSGKARELSIDHCHRTGKVRGLLCNNCNRAIGLLQDDPEVLKRAAEYVASAGASF